MLFNSYQFIFGFVPLTLTGFYVLGLISRGWALRWLILTSLCFYGWWRPLNILIIAPSILVNFALARLLQRLGDADERARARTAVLVLGIAFNVCFLGFFKYVDFLYGAINDAFGTELVLLHVILPLGISFITFQKIAFLVDIHGGRVKAFSFQDYCLFVLFFPQLIAGPIVHYREMMPQFAGAPVRSDGEDIAVGLTLFAFGLFKKVVLADNIAPVVSPIYEHANSMGGTSLLPAWIAAIGFTLQIYSDFSGYSDMALGLARLFGIRLPANFNSPLRASSIIDFWLRWHMTLTRFLTAYLYNPLVLSLTRRRMAKGRPGLAVKNTKAVPFLVLIVFPTLVTMSISGLWHGAGYLFVLWGVLHGVYLAINHAWRLLALRLWRDGPRYAQVMEPVGMMLTLLAVTAAMVVFRSSSVHAAVDLIKGMMGLNGVALPVVVYDRLSPLFGGLTPLFGVTGGELTNRNFFLASFWIPALTFVALACPNTLEILARYRPTVDLKLRSVERAVLAGRPLEWNFSLPWLIGISAIMAAGILSLAGKSEFLYWQF
jgi:alginate O-acetyltransferase complex protein AlgI